MMATPVRYNEPAVQYNQSDVAYDQGPPPVFYDFTDIESGFYHIFRRGGKERRLPDLGGYGILIQGANPTAHWRMDETLQDRTIADYSGNGFNGTWSGSPVQASLGLINDPYSYSVSLAATTTDFGTIPHNTGLNPGTSDFSIEVWVKMDGNPAGSEFILSKGDAPTTGYEVFISSSGAARARIGAITLSTSDGAVTDNTPHHLIFTFDRNGNGVCYLDGTAVHTLSIASESGRNLNTTEPLYFGRRNIGNYLTGFIDEISLYMGTALSVADVRDHYRVGVGNEGPRNRQLLASYEDEHSVAGGFMGASGVISYTELSNYPDIYDVGATWLTMDATTGEIVHAGDLRAPEVSQGVVNISCDGWAKSAERSVDRFLIQSENLEMWAPGDDEPFNYDSNARIPVEIVGNRIVFNVKRDTHFRQNKSGQPTEWITSVVMWAPRTEIRYIEFDLVRPKTMPSYNLQVFGATGPAGPATVFQSFGLGAGDPTRVTLAIPAGYDLIGIRLRRHEPTKKKTAAPHRRLIIKNIKWGNVWTGGPYTLTNGFKEVFRRLGASGADADIESSTQSIIPYDVEKLTLAEIADDLAVLGAWWWRIDANPNQTKRGAAGSFGKKTWNVTNPKQPIQLLPQEVFTHVVYEYRYGSDHYAQAEVSATTGSFPPGYRREFHLQLDDPPPEAIAELFAQKVADYLALPKTSGDAQIAEVVDPATSETVPSSRVKPGDGLNIIYDLAVEDLVADEPTLVYVSGKKHSESGITSFELTSGYPLLDQWLANRTRRMNQGWSSAKATLSLLDPDEPAAPTSLQVGFRDLGRHKGWRDLDMVVSWADVVDDIDGNGTAIKQYHVAARAYNIPAGGGTPAPIPHSEGGGWLRHTIGEPKDGDGLEDPPATEAIFKSLTHQPFKVQWLVKARAEDYLGQLSTWTTSPLTKPNLAGPPAPTNIQLDVEQHHVLVTWDQNDPNQAETGGEPVLDRSVAYWRVTLERRPTTSSTWSRVDRRRVDATTASFRVNRPEIHRYRAFVSAVDAYGNESTGVSSADTGGKHPPTPTSAPTLTFPGAAGTEYVKLNFTYSPGSYEDDINYYLCEVEFSPDGLSQGTTGDNRFLKTRVDDDEATVAEWDHNTRSLWYYRGRFRAVDRAGRKSGWSPYSTTNRPP